MTVQQRVTWDGSYGLVGMNSWGNGSSEQQEVAHAKAPLQKPRLQGKTGLWPGSRTGQAGRAKGGQTASRTQT